MTKTKIISKLQLKFIVEKYRIKMDYGSFVIRDDGLIDVNGNVKICNTNLQRLPLKFGKVYGDFLCNSNKLKTLKGCPEFVGGDFNCSNNNLKSLKDGPAEVIGDYSCQENDLINLEGCPNEIKGNFNAFLNQLITLNGGPEKILKSCYLHHNNLTSLKGPKYIGGSFYVSSNALIDLKGCPEFIGDILSFDNDVRIDLGNENCMVNSVVIQVQDKDVAIAARCLPKIVIDNQRYLPIVFRYFKYLTLFTNGKFNESDFIEFVVEIKNGLR